MPPTGQQHELVALPASALQSYFWELDRMRPGNPAWDVAVRFELEGPLDTAILERAINEIVRRHEVLRTTLGIVEGELRQLVHAELTVALRVIDLSRLGPEGSQKEQDRISVEEARYSFDITTLPLLRVALLKVSAERHLLLLNVHHVVFDGWSVGLFTDEIAAIYTGLQSNEEPNLPALSIQYGDYAVWQEQQFGQPKFAEQLAYWRRNLGGLKAPRVPTDHPRGPEQTFNGHIISQVLPRAVTDKLQAHSSRLGSTYFVTVLAAFQLLLHAYTAQRDIAVGTQMAGRDLLELEKMIGAFINTVIMRTEVREGITFADLAKDVHQTVFDAIANQELPYAKVVHTLQPEWPRVAERLFYVNFICQRDFVRPVHFSGVSLTPIPSKCVGAIYDLNVFLVERADGWRLSCEFNTDLYDESSAQKLLENYRRLLTAVADNPERKLSEYLALLEKPASVQPAEQSQAPAAATGSSTGSYVFPLTLAQRRFWMLDQLHPGNPALNVPANLRLRGPLDIELLERCFQALVARHELLRTRFFLHDGESMQEVLPDVDFRMERLDLRQLPEEHKDASAEQALTRAATTVFDFSRTPLIRVLLIQVRENESILGVTLPHVVFDGWSAGILFRELRELYANQADVSRLQPIQLQYADYSVWQKDFLKNSPYEKEQAYWKERLSGTLPVLDVPIDHAPSLGKVAPAGRESLQLPPDLAKGIKSLCQREGSTLFMGLLAGFETLLHRYSDATDILVGSPTANRNEQTEAIFGPFSNPVCLRVKLNSGMRFLELLKSAKETTLGALENQDMPFELLMPQLDAKPVRGRQPVFQYYFFYQTAFLQSFESGGVEFITLPERLPGAVSEIQLSVIDRQGTLTAHADYNASLYDPGTIQAMLRHYVKLLESAVASPDAKLSDLAVLTPGVPSDDVLSAALRGQRKAHSWNESAAATFVPPHSKAEWKMADIWKLVLEVDHISMDANFFDMGGSSMQALSMMQKIESIFGHKMTPNALFHAPTPRTLTALAGEPVVTAPVTLIPIHPGGTRPPLFWLPGGTGVSALAFRKLALLLGADQPSYGLEFNFDEHHEPEPTEARAQRCIEIIRKTQPSGPYGIVGFCFGGFIALEIAQQLRRAGEEIYFLSLINSYYPELPTKAQELSRKVQRFGYMLKAQSGNGEGSVLDKASAVIELSRRSFKSLAGNTTPQAPREPQPDAGVEFERRNAGVMNSYKPQPYSGRLLMMINSESIYKGVSIDLDRRLMWRRVAAGEQQIYTFAGQHVSILEPPSVADMAEVFQRELEAGRRRCEPEVGSAAGAQSSSPSSK